MKLVLGFKPSITDWLKLLLIPLLVCALMVYLKNLKPIYEATATIYPNMDNSVSNVTQGSLKQLSRSVRRLTRLMNRQAKQNNALSIEEKLGHLKSYKLSNAFIKKYKLKKILFAKRWDEENQQWKSLNKNSNKNIPAEPTLKKAAFVFNKKLRIKYNKKSGFITVKFTYKDPAIAAKIVNDFIDFSNEYITAEDKRRLVIKMVSYKELIAKTNNVDMKKQLLSQYESMLVSKNIELDMSPKSFNILSKAYIPEETKFKFSLFLNIILYIFSALCVFLYILLKNAKKHRKTTQYKNIHLTIKQTGRQ